jgi:hypothetical protein
MLCGLIGVPKSSGVLLIERRREHMESIIYAAAMGFCGGIIAACLGAIAIQRYETYKANKAIYEEAYRYYQSARRSGRI